MKARVERLCHKDREWNNFKESLELVSETKSLYVINSFTKIVTYLCKIRKLFTQPAIRNVQSSRKVNAFEA